MRRRSSIIYDDSLSDRSIDERKSFCSSSRWLRSTRLPLGRIRPLLLFPFFTSSKRLFALLLQSSLTYPRSVETQRSEVTRTWILFPPQVVDMDGIKRISRASHHWGRLSRSEATPPVSTPIAAAGQPGYRRGVRSCYSRSMLSPPPSSEPTKPSRRDPRLSIDNPWLGERLESPPRVSEA